MERKRVRKSGSDGNDIGNDIVCILEAGKGRRRWVNQLGQRMQGDRFFLTMECFLREETTQDGFRPGQQRPLDIGTSMGYHTEPTLFLPDPLHWLMHLTEYVSANNIRHMHYYMLNYGIESHHERATFIQSPVTTHMSHISTTKGHWRTLTLILPLHRQGLINLPSSSISSGEHEPKQIRQIKSFCVSSVEWSRSELGGCDWAGLEESGEDEEDTEDDIGTD